MRQYRGFILLTISVLLLLFLVLLVLASSVVGENNPAGWFLLVGWPLELMRLSLVIGLTLLIKFFINKVFKNFKEKQNLIIVFIVIPLTIVFNSILSPIDLSDSKEIILLSLSGALISGLIVVLVNILTFLFKIDKPNFWRSFITPLIPAYLMTTILSPFLLSGWNLVFK